jgi:membrane-associated phospholipid phosphatase
LSDSFVAAIGIGLVASVAAGPVIAYALGWLPAQWRRTAERLLVAAAVAIAVVADLLSDGPGASGPIVYVLAALPGMVAFLAWRSLLASTLIALAPLYFVIGMLTRGRPAAAPALALDRVLPVVPEWMLVYGSLYVFAVILPLAVVREPALVRRVMAAYLFAMIVSYVVFVLFPTTGPRPAYVAGEGFAAWALRGVYTLDAPSNCFPSLHVAYAFVAAFACFRIHRGTGVAAAGWATLIAISTVYTKQHYVVDAIGGAFVASVAYACFLRGYPRAAVADADRRRAPARALAVAGLFAVMIGGFWLAYRLG